MVTIRCLTVPKNVIGSNFKWIFVIVDMNACNIISVWIIFGLFFFYFSAYLKGARQNGCVTMSMYLCVIRPLPVGSTITLERDPGFDSIFFFGIIKDHLSLKLGKIGQTVLRTWKHQCRSWCLKIRFGNQQQSWRALDMTNNSNSTILSPTTEPDITRK